MTRRIRIAAGACAALALLVPNAQAATELGQSPPLAGSSSSCGTGEASAAQIAVAGGPSYQVPPGGGVITSWRTFVTDEDKQLALRVFTGDPAADQFTPVAESAPQVVVAGTEPSFPSTIPVSGGEFIGLHMFASTGVSFGCQYIDSAGDVMGIATGMAVKPLNEPETHLKFQWRLNVEATLEPDCDGDGLGDETQDADLSSCPQSDTAPPETTITKGAPNKTERSSVKFKFKANEPGSTFECKKDRKPWKPCTSPTKMKRLDEGKHKFKVRATDQAGNTGKPAKDKFKVVG